MRAGKVRDTAEFQRIERLPRRSCEASEWLTETFTRLLKTPFGTMSLKPIQALALHDIGIKKGGFIPVRVGGGKTLISLLSGYVLQGERILLVVPAALKRKTTDSRNTLCAHFRIPAARIRIESYELLGRTQAAELLSSFRPDVLVFDEGHRLKNKKAAVTKRVMRYFLQTETAGKRAKIVIMSGTISKRSIKDYAHLVGMCLPEDSPLPYVYSEAEDWARALDEKGRGDPDALIARAAPGPLVRFVDAAEVSRLRIDPDESTEDPEVLTALRAAYRKRFVETPGVVATTEGFDGASISVNVTALPDDPAIEAAFKHLRTYWEAPDGFPLTDGMQVWSLARQLARGFFYKWSPRAPQEWMDKRRNWGSFVRKCMGSKSLALDSEKMVAQACARGLLDDSEYRAWKEIEPTFKPNTVPVWISVSALLEAKKWLEEHREGIVWAEHVTYGEQLSALTGVPYFQSGGICKRAPDGRENLYLETYRGPAIASRSSCGTGMNLQQYWQNYIPTPCSNGLIAEQLLGRTHRDEQPSDEVYFDQAIGCAEDLNSFYQSLADARFIEATQGQAQKLCYADLTIDLPALRTGARWNVSG